MGWRMGLRVTPRRDFPKSVKGEKEARDAKVEVGKEGEDKCNEEGLPPPRMLPRTFVIWTLVMIYL